MQGLTVIFTKKGRLTALGKKEVISQLASIGLPPTATYGQSLVKGTKTLAIV